MTDTYGWEPFGAPRERQGASTQPFGFAGEQVDPETGLVYLRARRYDPRTGRFMSRDPFAGRMRNPLSLNRYSYMRNNPINWIDPRGLEDHGVGGDGGNDSNGGGDDSGIEGGDDSSGGGDTTGDPSTGDGAGGDMSSGGDDTSGFVGDEDDWDEYNDDEPQYAPGNEPGWEIDPRPKRESGIRRLGHDSSCHGARPCEQAAPQAQAPAAREGWRPHPRRGSR